MPLVIQAILENGVGVLRQLMPHHENPTEVAILDELKAPTQCLILFPRANIRDSKLLVHFVHARSIVELRKHSPSV